MTAMKAPMSPPTVPTICAAPAVGRGAAAVVEPAAAVERTDATDAAEEAAEEAAEPVGMGMDMEPDMDISVEATPVDEAAAAVEEAAAEVTGPAGYEAAQAHTEAAGPAMLRAVGRPQAEITQGPARAEMEFWAAVLHWQA